MGLLKKEDMKINTKAIAIGALLFVGTATVSGCNLGDIIRTKTPVSIQKSERLPESLTLNESQLERDRYIDDVQRNIAAWNENIEKGLTLQSLIGDIALTELNSERLALLGLPMGGPAALLLSFGIGTFLKRPGDKSAKEVASEKESSYNAGLKKGKDL